MILEENLEVDGICPNCGCKAVRKEEESGFDINLIKAGLFYENCQDWIMQTCYSKLSLDNTLYKLSFSLRGHGKKNKWEILSSCFKCDPTQQQLTKEDISITNNAEFLYGIIQRLKGLEVPYEVHPPYPYEVKAWDGYMDEDFLQELASLNPGLDVEGVLQAQQEDFFTLMIALGDIWGLGGSSVISRLFGQKLTADGKRLSVFCFYTALLCGIIVAVIMLLFRQPILHLLGADAETMIYASQYFTFIVLGAPFIIVSYTPSNLLRTEGFATASMTGTILGAIINIILDPIFISVLGLGAAGAAIATVIGNICTDIFFVWFLLTKSQRISINPVGFHITSAEISQILAIGIPASITNLMQSLSIALTNRYLLPYGNDKVAAMGIVMKINLIAVLILVGFAFGAQPLIGYNYGAKNKTRLKEILRFSYIFECSVAAMFTLILSLAAPAMIRIFMDDTSIIAVGVPMLRMQQVGMVFVAIVLVTTCTFQSAGKAVGAFLLSVSRQGIIFGAVIILASRLFGYPGVLAAQAVSDIFTAILAVGLFRHGIYKEIK